MYCCYCKRDLIDPKADKSNRRNNLSATRDHVLPRSQGGRYTVWCCRLCNMLKADMLPHLWNAFTRAHPSWWKSFTNHRQVIIAAGKAYAEETKDARTRAHQESGAER